jgi:hypothetical protein
MKKLILILTLLAFACSPLVMTPAQAAPAGHKLAAKIQKKKHQLKKLKHRQQVQKHAAKSKPAVKHKAA